MIAPVTTFLHIIWKFAGLIPLLCILLSEATYTLISLDLNRGSLRLVLIDTTYHTGKVRADPTPGNSLVSLKSYTITSPFGDTRFLGRLVFPSGIVDLFFKEFDYCLCSYIDVGFKYVERIYPMFPYSIDFDQAVEDVPILAVAPVTLR